MSHKINDTWRGTIWWRYNAMHDLIKIKYIFVNGNHFFFYHKYFFVKFHFSEIALWTYGSNVRKLPLNMCTRRRLKSSCVVRIKTLCILGLRKHVYSNILKILPPKNENFSAQNKDCGYSLEPPRQGGSKEYLQSMFLSRNKKNNVYPCKPQFYYIKVEFKEG